MVAIVHYINFVVVVFIITYLLTYPALQPLCGLGLPQECPKPLTISRLRLPVRYPGLNGERLHAISSSVLVDGLKRLYGLGRRFPCVQHGQSTGAWRA